MPLYLVPTDRDDGPVPVDKPVIFFGRHAGCDVIITCSRKVSRRHCCLAQVNNTLVVRDLGSMNGVRVSGVRVKHEARLKMNETLTIGDVDFVLKEGQYSVPRGKITIGPSLESLAPAGDGPKTPQKKKRPNAADPPAGFRGLKSSKPNRGSGRRGTPPRPKTSAKDALPPRDESPKRPVKDEPDSSGSVEIAVPDSSPDLDVFAMESVEDSGVSTPKRSPKKRPSRQSPADDPHPNSSGSLAEIIVEEDDDSPGAMSSGSVTARTDDSDDFSEIDLDEFESPPVVPRRPPKRQAPASIELSDSDVIDIDEPTPPPKPRQTDTFEDDPLPVSHSNDSIIELSEMDLLDD